MKTERGNKKRKIMGWKGCACASTEETHRRKGWSDSLKGLIWPLSTLDMNVEINDVPL